MRKDRRPISSQFLALSSQERTLLHKLYVERGKSADDIAAKYGLSVRSVYDRLKEHGIRKTGYAKTALRYCATCGQAFKKRPRIK